MYMLLLCIRVAIFSWCSYDLPLRSVSKPIVCDFIHDLAIALREQANKRLVLYRIGTVERNSAEKTKFSKFKNKS